MQKDLKRLITFYFLALFFLAGCSMSEIGVNSEPIKIHVFAAASLSEPFGVIGEAFEKNHPGTQVVFNFAGSQQLAQQIIQGAPADVFASANQFQMDAVIQAGEAKNGLAQQFTSNRLVVIYPVDHPLVTQGLELLAQEGIHLVMAAPEVPVGQYSLKFLEKANRENTFGTGFQEAVLKNVVSYEDNVKGVLSKVQLGEADAGIVYASDVTGENAKRTGVIEIPEALNIIAIYPIAVTKASKHPELAEDFVAYVLSPDGQAVLEQYNFAPPGNN